MCGIVGYVGDKDAFPILIGGLKRLEYRGYDSAGVAVLDGDIKTFKCKGKVADLLNHIGDSDTSGAVGIGHTRWATHGEPNDVNAHPHYSWSKGLAMVHNGIIENYDVLKQEMMTRGHKFKSDTDTEVLIHLIEDIQVNEKVGLLEALQIALGQVEGAYAIVILSKDNPNQLLAAKKGSPLAIGLGKEGDFYLASDSSPIVEYTNEVVYLENEEIAIIEKGAELKLVDIKNHARTPYVQELEMKLEQLEKGEFDHFMLKEIYEQPKALRDTMRGRVDPSKSYIQLGGINEYERKLINANRIIIISCGTSWHSAMIAEYMIETFARIPVEVEYASEFRYRDPIIYENDVLIAISQSGETADTIAAIELAKEKGATVLGICNVVGSTIARITHEGSYTHAGPEIGVASTKAFTSQVLLLNILAVAIADKRGMLSMSQFKKFATELYGLPDVIEETLKCDKLVKEIAAIYKDAENALYLGRGYCFPAALEGALKLKEISYIHAEGYPAAEMKHGPIALIDENMPVVVIANKGSSYEKMVSNIQEVKARKGKVIAIVTQGDKQVKDLADHIIEIPFVPEYLVPIVASIPLQLFSYHIAVMRGCDVDMPRNLAKSVTVE